MLPSRVELQFPTYRTTDKIHLYRLRYTIENQYKYHQEKERIADSFIQIPVLHIIFSYQNQPSIK